MIPEIFLGDPRSTCRTRTRTKHQQVQQQTGGRRLEHLKPLGAVGGGGGPGVGLALFVQTGEVRVPGERLHPPRAEGAGRRDLPVRHQARLHSHRLGTTWRQTREGGQDQETGSGKVSEWELRVTWTRGYTRRGVYR